MSIIYKDRVYEYECRNCDYCSKTISYFNWSRHIKTKSHKNNEIIHHSNSIIIKLINEKSQN